MHIIIATDVGLTVNPEINYPHDHIKTIQNSFDNDALCNSLSRLLV